MTVVLINIENAFQQVRFNWDDKGEGCDFVAIDIEDEIIDAMIAAKAHEGADFDGWTTDLIWE